MIKETSCRNYWTQKIIQDRFIDQCLFLQKIEQKNYLDSIPTGLKITSLNVISLDSQQRQLGRWSIAESIIYLQVLKSCHTTKNIIKKLITKLSSRIQSQIRAHHQKMMKKYGSREMIIRCLDRKENYELIKINQMLQIIDKRFSNLTKIYQNDKNQY